MSPDDDHPTEVTHQKAGDGDPSRRFSILFEYGDGARVASLREGESQIVGRGSQADIVLPSPGLSRKHARFTFEDGKLKVENLSSTNVIIVNGKQVLESLLFSGDEVCLGDVVATIRSSSAAGARNFGLEELDQFRARSGDELERARFFERPFSIAVLRPASGRRADISLIAAALRAKLRPIDRLGWYGPGLLLVRLPELGAKAAEKQLKTIAGATEPWFAGIAEINPAISMIDDLIDAARAQLAEADASTPIRVARPPESAWTPAANIDAGNLVVETEEMIALFATATRVAKSSIHALILGETGVGKEVVARAIHEQGRKDAPLLCINCGAIPASLVESELFGHERGAFTGALERKVGIFEAAKNGTVFLDEVGELSNATQVALLRVLESKTVTRLGGTESISIQCRVLAATHRDLDAMVAEGKFRADLHYRLAVVKLDVPPLRRRKTEIRALAERFFERARIEERSAMTRISAEAMALLCAYGWPGNVRELRNAIESAVVIGDGPELAVENLPAAVRAEGRATGAMDSVELEPIEEKSPPPETSFSAEGEEAETGDLDGQVRSYERKLIIAALERKKRLADAAELLGISLRTLVYKIKKLGITKRFD